MKTTAPLPKPLDLLAPLCAIQLWISILLCWPAFPFWRLLLAAAGFALALWRVGAGGKVVPAAAASAAIVLGLIWSYGVLAFLLLMAVGSVAVWWIASKLGKSR